MHLGKGASLSDQTETVQRRLGQAAADARHVERKQNTGFACGVIFLFDQQRLPESDKSHTWSLTHVVTCAALTGELSAVSPLKFK